METGVSIMVVTGTYEGGWAPVGRAMIANYGLRTRHKLLDIGCGKGFQLYGLS